MRWILRPDDSEERTDPEEYQAETYPPLNASALELLTQIYIEQIALVEVANLAGMLPAETENTESVAIEACTAHIEEIYLDPRESSFHFLFRSRYAIVQRTTGFTSLPQ